MIETSGKPNRLIKEKSPYLLEHAYNPVDWYPWGKEAFDKARHENKPIFLSIGYSSCHWCHVFRKESLEDPEIARMLNNNFVSIKVDREERPDIDEIYMKSVVTMTGSGGWPLNVFLTPSLEPFYGGTYFPPSPRYGMPSFSNVLRSISQAWKSDRKKIVESASEMKGSLRELYEFRKSPDSKIDRAPIEECYEALAGSFDSSHGGFGEAPKFPTPSNLLFLMRYHNEKKSDSTLSLNMVRKTLDSMMRGGIFDQVGGGFHRYSTDRYWLIPHFEKMLYDNALLAIAYSEAFVVTRNEEYSRIVSETLDWVLREMKDPQGGFYSAIDADSPDGEGSYYSWTFEEVDSTLKTAGFKAEEVQAVSKFFSITHEGNFEGGRTVLTAKPPVIAAKDTDISAEELSNLIDRGRDLLLSKRAERPKPSIDDKILTGWNGLMISAFSKAYDALGEEKYLSVAKACADFVLENLYADGGGGEKKLLRRYRMGESKGDAVLEDYAFLVNGLIDLYESGFESRYLAEALALSKMMIAKFYDEAGGGFFQTVEGTADLIARAKDTFDGALPSGNSVAILVCLRLAEMTVNDELRKKATDSLLAFWEAISRQPASFTEMITALQFLLSSPKEIVVSGRLSDSQTRSLIGVLRSRFLPNSTLLLADEGGLKISPLIQDRIPVIGDAPKVFVCSNFTCKLPSKSEIELIKALEGM